LLSGTDACFAPVLSLPEAAEDEHIGARKCFVAGEGMLQPAPAPKFSATPQEVGDIPRPGEHTEKILQSLGKAG
jgi:alpha-methylacyl-CoA racemase